MNELFRFVSVRPPGTASDEKTVKASKLMEKSALLADLGKAKDKASRAAVATKFRKTANFIDSPTKLRLPLMKVADVFSKVDDGATINVAKSIETAAGARRSEIIRSAEFVADRLHLLETALALRESGEPRGALYKNTYKLIAAVRLLEKADTFGEAMSGKKVKAFLESVTVELPPVAAAKASAEQPKSLKAGPREKSEQRSGMRSLVN